MINNIIFLFLAILNLVICWPIPPAEVPVFSSGQSADVSGIPDYSGINDANIETEILSGNDGNSLSESFGNNGGEIVDQGMITESNDGGGYSGGYGGFQSVKEAVLVPKRQRRILARYKVIIPVIIPQIRVRIPNRSNSYGDRSDNNGYDSYSGRVSQNPG